MLYPTDNPPNPFRLQDREYFEETPPPDATTTVYEDHSRTILSKNDSPDLGFRYSVNPYRGCYHACAYCYARPTHEYLDLGAGTDFDRKLTVKPHAPELLRQAFDKPGWKGELVMFSGITDCYQPVENHYELTRKLLEVCLEYRNPVAIITKSALIERDRELLVALSKVTSVRVLISLAFDDAADAKAMEPFVTTPERRLTTLARLADAGLDVGVMVAPIIPGLNDEQMVKVLGRAKQAGARRAGYVLLRLPGSVKDVFLGRLTAAFPERASKILGRLRQTRDGQLYDARFGVRGRGEGKYAELIARLFGATIRRLGLEDRDAETPPLDTFRRPERPKARTGPQLSLPLL